MKKSIYAIPQIKTVKPLALNRYMLEDWSAPDGGGGGGNEPEANENVFFDEGGSGEPKKSVWD